MCVYFGSLLDYGDHLFHVCGIFLVFIVEQSSRASVRLKKRILLNTI